MRDHDNAGVDRVSKYVMRTFGALMHPPSELQQFDDVSGPHKQPYIKYDVAQGVRREQQR